ncbi:MAG: FG-GAP-like repeat-containing protein [Planctomycetota bacterium]
MTLADLNDDYNLDIVAGSTFGLGVYLGQGNGRYSGIDSYLKETSILLQIELADFNLDGFQDVAVADLGPPPNFEWRVSVLLGNGNGTFNEPNFFYTFPRVDWMQKGDVDANGTVDLVVSGSHSSESRSHVLLGQNDGSFKELVPVHFEGRMFCAPALGDFDGDERPDLAVSLAVPQRFFILPGLGDGTFGNSENFAGAFTVTGLTAYDAQGDGDSELLVLQNGGFRVLDFPIENENQSQTRVIELNNEPVSITSGDFNADGIVDIATANDGGLDHSISILLGQGDGDFLQVPGYEAEIGVLSLCSSDFNGDGISDLAIANSGDSSFGNSIWVQLGLGDGTFSAPSIYQNEALRPQLIRTSDFNQDGLADLVYINRLDLSNSFADTISIRYGFGDGTFSERFDFDVGLCSSRLEIQDFNGDGWEDLAITSFVDDFTTLLLNDQRGGFSSFQLDFLAGSSGDYNGDATADLISYGEQNSFEVRHGSGNGTFLQPVSYPLSPFSSHSFFSGDFDDNGMTDVAAIDVNRTFIFTANGNDGFSSPQVYPMKNPGSGAVDDDPVIEDFNGDGRLDFAAISASPDQVTVFLNQGSGAILIGDVNHDGVIDLQDVAPFVAVLVDAGFQTEADINCDGRVDLLDVSPFVELLNGV